MFADPQAVTISGSAKSLNRTSSTADGGRFSTADRAHRLEIQHVYGRRHRHTAKFQVDSLVANPLVSGQNVNQSVTLYLTADAPPGYDAATLKAIMDGFLANMTASTGANLTKLVGGES